MKFLYVCDSSSGKIKCGMLERDTGQGSAPRFRTLKAWLRYPTGLSPPLAGIFSGRCGKKNLSALPDCMFSEPCLKMGVKRELRAFFKHAPAAKAYGRISSSGWKFFKPAERSVYSKPDSPLSLVSFRRTAEEDLMERQFRC